MATKPKQSPEMMMKLLDGVQKDTVTVHIRLDGATPAQFASQSRRCPEHGPGCTLVVYRPVEKR